MLRRQRAIEIVPSSKPLRWRRYDVPQHLAPETTNALRFCAVEGDLDLLDRRHRSTIGLRLSHRRAGRRRVTWVGHPPRAGFTEGRGNHETCLEHSRRSPIAPGRVPETGLSLDGRSRGVFQPGRRAYANDCSAKLIPWRWLGVSC